MFGKKVVAEVENKLREIGMTKGEFYNGSGISSATFSQWRTGAYEPSTEALSKIEEFLSLSFQLSSKENHAANKDSVVEEKNKRLIEWFRSLPEEKQKAILIAQDGPEDAV